MNKKFYTEEELKNRFTFVDDENRKIREKMFFDSFSEENVFFDTIKKQN